MALQDILSGMGNPAASRSAILQRLGIDPNRAAGYGGNTQFDQGMANLYTQGLKTASDLDTEEGNIGRNYQQNLAQSAIDRDKALKAIQGSYAQRGMHFSGANIDEQAEATGNFDRYVANLGADKEAGIGAIGRNRLNLEQGLQSGRSALEEGYGSDLSAFLQQQALDLWNSVVAQNQQNAMMQAMNRPAVAAPAPRPAAPRLPAPVARPTTTAARPVSTMGTTYGGTIAKKPTPMTAVTGAARR